MREPSPLLLILDMVDRPNGLWLCLRGAAVAALEGFEESLDELQETLECRGITYSVMWDFIEGYGNAWETVKGGVQFLDGCCVRAMVGWPEAMYMFGCVVSFGRLAKLLTPFIESVVGMLESSKAGTAEGLPVETSVESSKLLEEIDDGSH